MNDQQIYMTLKALKEGQDVSTIPMTILKELSSYGYIKYIIPEGSDVPFVALILDRGNQFIHNYAQKN